MLIRVYGYTYPQYHAGTWAYILYIDFEDGEKFNFTPKGGFASEHEAVAAYKVDQTRTIAAINELLKNKSGQPGDALDRPISKTELH